MVIRENWEFHSNNVHMAEKVSLDVTANCMQQQDTDHLLNLCKICPDILVRIYVQKYLCSTCSFSIVDLMQSCFLSVISALKKSEYNCEKTTYTTRLSNWTFVLWNISNFNLTVSEKKNKKIKSYRSVAQGARQRHKIIKTPDDSIAKTIASGNYSNRPVTVHVNLSLPNDAWNNITSSSTTN